MEYRLDVAGRSRTIPGGTGILLLHPSTAATDRIDTEFLRGDTDHYLVVSTRTTASEVDQKLEFYDVDRDRATILDAISIERGYSRRQSDRVTYLRSPSDINGLVNVVTAFLSTLDGKRRISFDSVTELSYYAGDRNAFDAMEALIELLEEHEAIGLFHLAVGVHDEDVIDEYRRLFDIVIQIDEDGSVTIDD